MFITATLPPELRVGSEVIAVAAGGAGRIHPTSRGWGIRHTRVRDGFNASRVRSGREL